MRYLALALLAVALSGCGVTWASDLSVPRGSIFGLVDPLPPVEPKVVKVSDPAATEAARKAEWCSSVRSALGLPILFNRALKNEANTTLGADKSAQLFWPVAKTNNAFRCLCGTPEERVIAKCGN